jgi:ribosome maturation protein SDO1
MDEAKVQVDHFKSVEEQMKIIVDKLRPILPISFENKKYTVIIPAQYSNQGYGILKRFGKITKENWLATGAIQADVEMPAGMSADFVDKLNKLTHGDIQIDER